jgi:exosortase E/protease (VPEID-CTERM system)
MSSESAPSLPRGRFWLWPGAFAGLVLVEAGFLILGSDLVGQAGDGRLVQKISRNLQAQRFGGAGTMLVLALLCFLAQGRQGWRALVDFYPRSATIRLLAFVGHLACLAYFVVLLQRVLDDSVEFAPVGRWALAGAACISLASIAVLPRPGPSTKTFFVLATLGLVAVVVGTIGNVTQRWWSPLGTATLWVVSWLLSLVFQDTVCRPLDWVVGTQTFAVVIDPACSGYEGIGLIVTLLAVYLTLARRQYRFPHVLLLFPVAAVVIWLVNSVRISSLVAVGVLLSPDVALNGFHSQMGWLLFSATALGLIALSRRISWLRYADTARAAHADRSADAAYLAPFLTILAVGMITRALTIDFDWFYPVRVVAVLLVLYVFRRSYGEFRWSWSWPAAAAGVLVFLLWIGLARNEPDPAASPTYDGLVNVAPLWAALWGLFRVLGAVVTVPVAEELAFRGYLMRRLMASRFQDVPCGAFSWFSFLISSLLFGLMHERWLAGTLAGLVYALVLYHRKRLGDAVVAHAVTNGLLAVEVVRTGSWSLW